MAVAYTSNRFPVGFTPRSSETVQNGSLATANTFFYMAENQHWLVLADPCLVHFYTGLPQDVLLTSTWTNTAKTIRLMVPPFAQYGGFHFLVTRNLNSDPPVVTGIQITCATSTRFIRNISWGEDRDAVTGKTDFVDGLYGWVHADQISLNPQDGDTGALKLIGTPSETWTTVDVTITVPSSHAVKAAAYNIIPNTTGYVVYT